MQPDRPFRSSPTTSSHRRYHDDKRIPALLTIFEESQADLICLQEVDKWFLKRLKKQPWFQKNYRAPRHLGEDAIANGNYIFARHEVERVEVIDHRSPQGRESIVVHLRVHGRPLAIATCHLESLLRDGPVRARQLDDVFARLAKTSDTVFAGDFNFGDGEQPETGRLPPDYLDLWTALHPKRPGFTWNIDTNDMAARGSFVREPSRRLDRILLCSKHWQPVSIRILGETALDEAGIVFPSDHFGLLGVIRARR